MLTRAFSFQREWKQIDTSFSLILHNELQLQQKHHLHLIIKVLHVPGMLQKKKKTCWKYYSPIDAHQKTRIRSNDVRKKEEAQGFVFFPLRPECFCADSTNTHNGRKMKERHSNNLLNAHTHPARLASDHHGWLPDVIFPPEKQLKANKGWIPALIVLVVSRELLFLCPCTHTTPCLHRKLNIWWLQMTSDLQHVQEEP